uniref:Uncharacterized protein n=1 Tax=Anguilla anguilla TaxID=7936 RepID=A0A0E9VPQ6_ANGAN
MFQVSQCFIFGMKNINIAIQNVAELNGQSETHTHIHTYSIKKNEQM